MDVKSYFAPKCLKNLRLCFNRKCLFCHETRDNTEKRAGHGHHACSVTGLGPVKDFELIVQGYAEWWLFSAEMSLLTVQRSPSETASIDTESEDEEEEDEVEDSFHTSASSRSRASSFEGYFASKGAAFALPDGDFTRKAVIGKHGGELQLHLQPMVNLLRDEDTMRLVVKVQSQYPNKTRYMSIVSAFTDDDVEESLVVGIDWSLDGTICTIGLVLPLWRDTSIHLDGDGGFKVSTNGRHHIMKPVSVQTMWTAFQWIHKCSDNATKHNFFPGGSSLHWRKYYEERVNSDRISINEWHEMDDLWSRRSESPTQIVGADAEYELLSKLIKHKLREVMMRVDLEEVTSKQIRTTLEEEMQMDFSARNFKEFIDQEMITILGQMDSPSLIFDHVYLGSEWNASNLEELQANRVGYILNVTREIDNFFPGTFVYHNVRVWDVEESELLKHWDKTYRFITEAKENNSKVLVHCKMGVSRSASTVIAYGMKENGWSLHDTMKHVKNKRSCIQPNAGFWKQLVTYEGILNSSKQRYNAIFHRRRSHSDSSETRESAKRKRENRKLHKKYSTIEHARAAVIADGRDNVDSGPLSRVQESPQEGEEMIKEETTLYESSECSSSSDESINSSSDGDDEEDELSEIQTQHKEVEMPVSNDDSPAGEIIEIAGNFEASSPGDNIKVDATIAETKSTRTELTTEAAPAHDKLRRGKKPIHRVLSVPATLSKVVSDNIQRSSSLEDCSTQTQVGREKFFSGSTEKNVINKNLISEVGPERGDRETEKDQNKSVIEVSRIEESSDVIGVKLETNELSQEKQTVVLRREQSLESDTSAYLDVLAQSGKVKRRSRNFEVGIFNISSDSDSDSETANVLSNESETSAEHFTVEIGEPKKENETGPGVVKKHTQAIELKYRESLKRDSFPVRKSTSSLSEDEPETDKNVTNPEGPLDSSNVETTTVLPLVEKSDQGKLAKDVLSTSQEVHNVKSSEQEMSDVINIEQLRGEAISEGVAESMDQDVEIPEAGLVKKKTLLLEERVKGTPSQSVEPKEETPVLDKDIQPVEVSDQNLNTVSPPMDASVNVVIVTADETNKQSNCDTDQENIMLETEPAPPVAENKTGIEEDLVEKTGLVKRHTLLIEGRMKLSSEDLSTEPDTAASESGILIGETRTDKSWSETDQLGKNSNELNVHVNKNKDDVGETNASLEPGHVKRHKLRLEGRSISLPETVSVPELKGLRDLGGGENNDEPITVMRSYAVSDTVDTTSVVRVKRHTQVIEDVIREATERDYKKVTKEDIETSQNTETESTLNYSMKNPLKVIVIPRSPDEPRQRPLKESKSRQAVLEALERTHQNMDAEEDDTHTKWAQANVRQRIQILEDIIILAQAFENQTKVKGVSVQRHESLPKSMRSFGKYADPSIHFRKRSFSTESATKIDDPSHEKGWRKDGSQQGEGKICTLPRDWKMRQTKDEQQDNVKRQVESKKFTIEKLSLEEINYCNSQENEKEKVTLIVTDKKSGQI